MCISVKLHHALLGISLDDLPCTCTWLIPASYSAATCKSGADKLDVLCCVPLMMRGR